MKIRFEMFLKIEVMYSAFGMTGSEECPPSACSQSTGRFRTTHTRAGRFANVSILVALVIMIAVYLATFIPTALGLVHESFRRPVEGFTTSSER